MTEPNGNGTNGNDRRSKEKTASRRLAVAAGLAATAVLVVSFIQGPPDEVPDLALGWPVILYIERAALTAYVIMGLGGLGYRLWRGDQVKEAGAGGQNVALEEAGAAADESAEGIAEVGEVVDESVRDLNDRMLDVEKQLAELKGDEPPPEGKE